MDSGSLHFNEGDVITIRFTEYDSGKEDVFEQANNELPQKTHEQIQDVKVVSIKDNGNRVIVENPITNFEYSIRLDSQQPTAIWRRELGALQNFGEVEILTN